MLIVKLLATACAAAALTTVPACRGGECPEWAAPEPYAPLAELDVVAVGQDNYRYGRYYAVVAGGRIVELGTDAPAQQVADVELHGVAGTQELLVVVGAGGRVMAAPIGTDHWQIVDIGTTAELWQVVTLYESGELVTVIVGDGVMFVYEPANFAWKPVAPPEGGWGDLRAINQDWNGKLVAVGRGGVVWTTDALSGPWTREDAGTDADLTTLAGTRAGGTGGTLIERSSDGTWQRIDLGTTSDVVSLFRDYTLTSDGNVYEGATATPLFELGPGLRVLLVDFEDVLVLGAAGTHQLVNDRCEYSESGRPFIVEHEVRMAAATKRVDWCVPSGAATEMSEETCDGEAGFWTAAGLAEHASIASFARALLELMSLGAPPELLRETQTALADEIEHARLCFAQARRCGGAAVGPGPLPVDERSLARVGDPVAIALAVFEEGCMAEGVAAAEAAMQAEVCRDPETRAVFRQLARDETRHAALAWKTLRWLLDRYGELVAGPLRSRLARMMASAGRASEGHEQGWLSARERAAIRRQVVRHVVQPLAFALLGDRRAATEVRS